MIVLHIHQQVLCSKPHRQAVVVGTVGLHRHAETGVPSLAALHQGKLYLVAHTLVIAVCNLAIFQEDGVQSSDAVDVAWAGKDDQASFIDPTLPVFILSEVKQGLGDRVKDLFREKSDFAS